MPNADDFERYERLDALFEMAPAVRRTIAGATYAYGPFVAGGEPHDFDACHAVDLVPMLFFQPVLDDWTYRQLLALALLPVSSLVVARDSAVSLTEAAVGRAALSMRPADMVDALTRARNLNERNGSRDPDHSVGQLLLGSALLLSADDDQTFAEARDELRKASASPVFRCRFEALARLAILYTLAYMRTEFTSQLDTAVEHIRACLDVPVLNTGAAGGRTNAIAAIVFHARYAAGGGKPDLEKAVTHGRTAIAGLPEDCPYRHLLVLTVGRVVLQHHRLLGRGSNLPLAQQLLDEALAVVPRDSPHWTFVSCDAAAARLDVAATAGEARRGIAEALDVHARIPAGHPARLMLGFSIADVMRRLPWPESGDARCDAVQDEIVALLTEGAATFAAVVKHMNDHEDGNGALRWGNVLAAYSWLLCLCAHRTKDEHLLNEAVTCALGASDMPPEETVNSPVVLLRAGQVLSYAHSALSEDDLLAEAVRPLREAFRTARAAVSDEDLATYRAALALALDEQLLSQRVVEQLSFVSVDDDHVMDEQRRAWGRDLYRLAVEMVDLVLPLTSQLLEEHKDRRHFQWCAGRIIESVGEVYDIVHDLVDPLELFRRCTTGASPESPERTAHHLALMGALEVAEGADLREAAVAARDAAWSETRDLRGRLEGAHKWLALTSEADWSDLPARDAVEAAMVLRAYVSDVFPDYGQRLGVLAEDPWLLPTIADVMSTVASAQDDRDHAIAATVRVVESGRCTLLRRMSGDPSGLGYSVAELKQDAADGPLVLLNPTERSYEAVLVCADSVEAMELPITDDAAMHLHARLADALQESQNASRESDEAGQHRAQFDIANLLADLWRDVARPVLAAIGLDRVLPGRAPRRVWWIPGGNLSLLPLHAASPLTGDDVPEHERLGALGLVASSYAPSLAMLRAARAGRAATPAHGRHVLAVACSEVQGAPRLPAAREEVDSILGLFPGSLGLVNREATRGRVLRELSGYPWVHFAGHAASQTFSANSRMGELVLSDHHNTPLTGLDIAGVRVPGADLAFLSGCETATPEGFITNEAFHLGSAFHLAGYRQVVSTLWPAVSSVAKEMAQAFYEHARANPDSHGAESLRAATRLLREKYPNSPLLWAGHVHSGA